jgi:hypothetical protein
VSNLKKEESNTSTPPIGLHGLPQAEFCFNVPPPHALANLYVYQTTRHHISEDGILRGDSKSEYKLATVSTGQAVV